MFLKGYVFFSAHSPTNTNGYCAPCATLVSLQKIPAVAAFFCALFAEYLLGQRQSLMFDASNINFYRNAMWRTMVENAAEEASLCRTCGEKECPRNSGGKVDKWVRYLNSNSNLRYDRRNSTN